MAGDLSVTELLLGMGLRRFSMNTSQLLSVKQRLFDLDSKAATRLTTRLLRMSDPTDIRAALARRDAVARRSAGVPAAGKGRH